MITLPHRFTTPALSGFLLAGCAAYAPTGLQDGATESQILQSMGSPTARYALPNGGMRLEYRRGPSGRHTYMLDLDPQGHLTGKDQVLDARHFSTLGPGMSEDTVLRTIGHPGFVTHLGYQQRELWSYRYDAPICQLFQVSFNVQGLAVEVGFGRDASCDPDSD